MHNRIIWLVMMVLAIGLGVVAWQLQLLITEKNRAHITQTLQKQSEEIVTLTETVKRHEAQFQQVAQHSNQLTEAIKTLDREMREGNPSWRYAQIQYYLERAAQEAYVMKDPVSAKQWLEVALKNSLSLNQANLLPVQEAIQKDIQDLSQQGANVVTQAMLSLSALSDTVQAWPHKQATEQMEANSSVVSENTETHDWQGALMTGWNQLKSLVRVRTVKGEVIPYFSADEKSMINQNVSLMLTEATFSAMRGNEAMYAQNIARAKEWIMRYYDVNTPVMQDALNTINHLSTINVNYVPPSRLKSFDAWNGFMQQNGKSS